MSSNAAGQFYASAVTAAALMTINRAWALHVDTAAVQHPLRGAGATPMASTGTALHPPQGRALRTSVLSLHYDAVDRMSAVSLARCSLPIDSQRYWLRGSRSPIANVLCH